jgi:hypothetical protein
MERLLGWKFWAFAVMGYVFSALSVGQALHGWLNKEISHLPALEKLAPMLFGAIFFVLFLKPVWRWFWRLPILGPWLSRTVFPDLNGEWDVKLITNWPRIEAMKKAAKDSAVPRYDAENGYGTVDLRTVETFEKAVIDQGWSGVKMTLHVLADRAHDSSDKAEESVTISFDLLRDRVGRSQIAYVYAQKNKMPNLAVTDVDDFFGAAVLTVLDERANQMKGTYFTARNWVRGYNTAGELTLTRRSETSAVHKT